MSQVTHDTLGYTCHPKQSQCAVVASDRLCEGGNYIKILLPIVCPVPWTPKYPSPLSLNLITNCWLAEYVPRTIGATMAVGLGAFFRWARRSSVKAPRPMLVKKLMANLVSLGLSRGISPSQESDMVASRVLTIPSSENKYSQVTFANFYLSTNFVIPRNSASSWKSILMKILELEVVSSSFNLMTCNTSQPMASVCRRWEKNLETFLK